MAKIMLFLTGNAEGFRVSERTICHRCNISESGYKKARKKLVDKQWIFHKAGGYIQVNFNKIFSDYKALEAGCLQDDSQETEEKDDVGAFEILSNPSEDSSVQATGNTEKTEGGFPQNTYNNINNNINNIIKSISEQNNITGYCEDTRSAAADAAASQASSQLLRRELHTKKEIEKAKEDYFSWYSTQERIIERKYNYAQSNEDFKRMVESEEYNTLQTEALEKRNALEQEYGTMFQHREEQ